MTQRNQTRHMIKLSLPQILICAIDQYLLLNDELEVNRSSLLKLLMTLEQDTVTLDNQIKADKLYLEITRSYMSGWKVYSFRVKNSTILQERSSVLIKRICLNLTVMGLSDIIYDYEASLTSTTLCH